MRRYEIDDFSLDAKSLRLNETIFHNANGYLGVRGTLEEGYPDGYDSVRGTYINGFYDFVPMPQAEKLYGLVEKKQTMVNVIDTQGILLTVCGENFTLDQGVFLSKKRYLDMDGGVTVREMEWQSPKGNVVRIVITRMCSFHILPLFLVKYEVAALNFEGEVRITSTHKGDVNNYFNPNDPRVAGESFQHMLPKEASFVDHKSIISSVTARSKLSVSTVVAHTFDRKGTVEEQIQGHMATVIYSTDMKQGEVLTCYKYSVICDSVRYPETDASAMAIMENVLGTKVEELYEDQAAYLKKFWEHAGVEVMGEEKLNEAIQYNMFQLVQSAGKDPHSNVAAKGLSGEGYEGHYFWDTEMYLQPFYILNERKIAKNLIRYRYTILDAAKENARILGHKKGAAYPWRTIMGEECSGYFPSGSAQYHISGDVAYAIVSYYLATKDVELLEECGCEILIETARLWMDLGNYSDGKFMINTVTGPDEYTCLVNNNYYTNSLAAYNLLWAVKALDILKKAGRADRVLEKTHVTNEELAAFAEASDKMYLPYDEKLGINPQDDSFLQKAVWDISAITEDEKPLLLHYHPMYLYRFQICKQADTVLAHFILEDAQDIETIRKSFAYYEKVTTHDSSLSTCIFSIVAAKLGELDKAYEYLGESAKLDLFNTHNNTQDGIHTANMGGTYMAMVYGFGGLRLKEDGLHLAPVLPAKWQGYRFRFLYEESELQVVVKGNVTTLELINGDCQELYLYGKKIFLHKGESFEQIR